ncbi:MAG TPA: hypothetical protein VKC57_03300 [Ktedonobacterales bacterium]|nr:hypothetical protein [Ktedonobacterales bacterium]
MAASRNRRPQVGVPSRRVVGKVAGSRAVARLRVVLAARGTYQVVTLVLLAVVLVESAVLLVRQAPAPVNAVAQLPSTIPLPVGAALARTDDLLTEHIQNWYYDVPHFSEDAVLAFYRAQLAQHAWRCFASMASTNIQQAGQPITGTGMYITAVRGATKVMINSGSLAYGGTILGDTLDPDAVALKISIEPAQQTPCPS